MTPTACIPGYACICQPKTDTTSIMASEKTLATINNHRRAHISQIKLFEIPPSVLPARGRVVVAWVLGHVLFELAPLALKRSRQLAIAIDVLKELAHIWARL